MMDRKVLQLIWDNLPQGLINNSVEIFSKQLNAHMKACGEHFH